MVSASRSSKSFVTQKQQRGGSHHWSLHHLDSEDKTVVHRFTNGLVPMAREMAGTIPPWKNLSPPEVQTIVDDVFGEGVYTVTPDGPWMGLVCVSLLTAVSHWHA